VAFTNLFSLGVAVDLYFSADGETWEPVADLPSGTITVVNGVVQCRDLPENLDGAGVGFIKAVPREPNYGDVPLRITVGSVSIPHESRSTMDFFAGVDAGAQSIEYNDYEDTDEDDVVTALDPATVVIGVMPESDPVVAPGAYWGYTETAGV
jgi:hypothetical protein